MSRKGMTAVLLFLLFAGGSAWRARVVWEASRNKVVSAETLWKEHGYPVDVATADRGPVRRAVKVTGLVRADGTLSAEVDPDRAAVLSAGQSFVNARGVPPWSGTVVRVAPVPSFTTGLYEVILKTASREKPLPGDLETARVFTDGDEKLLRVPLPALSENGEAFVWVVRDGRAARTPIRTGRRDDRFVRVIAGLASGDRVVVRGVPGLKDGDKVWVHKGGSNP